MNRVKMPDWYNPINKVNSDTWRSKITEEELIKICQLHHNFPHMYLSQFEWVELYCKINNMIP